MAQDIDIEREELNRLVSSGVSFEVDRIIFVRKPGISGLIGKRIAKAEKLKFTIQEPTLSTLDRMSSEQIELRIDEKVMTSDSALSEARKMTNLHSKRMAKIVALAVLGQDYIIAVQDASRIIYKKDEKKLSELTELFFNCIKPSKLMQLVLLINPLENLGDFTNSIRLMSAARTTIPNLVEEGKKA